MLHKLIFPKFWFVNCKPKFGSDAVFVVIVVLTVCAWVISFRIWGKYGSGGGLTISGLGWGWVLIICWVSLVP